MEFDGHELSRNSKFRGNGTSWNVVHAQRALSVRQVMDGLECRRGIKETLRALKLPFLILLYPSTLPIHIQPPIPSSISRARAQRTLGVHQIPRRFIPTELGVSCHFMPSKLHVSLLYLVITKPDLSCTEIWFEMSSFVNRFDCHVIPSLMYMKYVY